MCACVCARARVCVCVCVCVKEEGGEVQTDNQPDREREGGGRRC